MIPESLPFAELKIFVVFLIGIKMGMEEIKTEASKNGAASMSKVRTQLYISFK